MILTWDFLSFMNVEHFSLFSLLWIWQPAQHTETLNSKSENFLLYLVYYSLCTFAVPYPGAFSHEIKKNIKSNIWRAVFVCVIDCHIIACFLIYRLIHATCRLCQTKIIPGQTGRRCSPTRNTCIVTNVPVGVSHEKKAYAPLHLYTFYTFHTITYH